MSGQDTEALCACGRPLHYTNPIARKMVDDLIEQAGDEDIIVHVGKRAWKVQRHFIALHGLKAQELPRLGFPEVKP